MGSQPQFVQLLRHLYRQQPGNVRMDGHKMTWHSPCLVLKYQAASSRGVRVVTGKLFRTQNIPCELETMLHTTQSKPSINKSLCWKMIASLREGNTISELYSPDPCMSGSIQHDCHPCSPPLIQDCWGFATMLVVLQWRSCTPPRSNSALQLSALRPELRLASWNPPFLHKQTEN